MDSEAPYIYLILNKHLKTRPKVQLTQVPLIDYQEPLSYTVRRPSNFDKLSMMFSFTKMHGLGNDFMVIDATQSSIILTPDQIQALSRRDTGVGFDQCLLVEKSSFSGVDFFYRIFNADGQEVGQCGNGARCLARFVQRRGLTTKTELCIKTTTTTMRLKLHADHTVTVIFDCPRFIPSDIPINTHTLSSSYVVQSEGQNYTFHALSVGNPHAVLVVKELAAVDIERIGSQLSTHPFFPQHTNVGFLQILSPTHVKLRVYERGCGETKACGSGAVAAVAAGRLFHQLADEVIVSLPGGDLTVSWPDVSQSIFLRGPATFVYEGQLLENH